MGSEKCLDGVGGWNGGWNGGGVGETVDPDPIFESLQQGRPVSHRTVEAFAATEWVLEVIAILGNADTIDRFRRPSHETNRNP